MMVRGYYQPQICQTASDTSYRWSGTKLSDDSVNIIAKELLFLENDKDIMVCELES